MTPKQQIRWGYAGVIVTLAVIAIVSTSGLLSPVAMLMFASLAMLNVANIAQASDKLFYSRNRWLMLIICMGVSISPALLVGDAIVKSENSSFPLWLRWVLAMAIAILTVGCAILGTIRSTTSNNANQAKGNRQQSHAPKPPPVPN